MLILNMTGSVDLVPESLEFSLESECLESPTYDLQGLRQTIISVIFFGKFV